MKKVFIVISLIITPTFFLGMPMAKAQQVYSFAGIAAVADTVSGSPYLLYAADSLQGAGYTCVLKTLSFWASGGGSIRWLFDLTCTKTYAAGYGASAVDDFTLNGFQNFVTDTQAGRYAYVNNSPFLYLHHPPEGTVSISLSSALDRYFPKPAFNQKNGWQVQAKDNTLSVDETKEPHLFYELAIPSITLTRNGRNFSSKADVVSFLKDSDFFTRLGFSPEEKQNSLSYLLPKIASAPTTPNYYLTILDPDAVEDISHLHITPAPNTTLRHYLALYPNSVPVQTTGDFVYPQAREEGNSFVAKETGEIVVTEGMVVFFR